MRLVDTRPPFAGLANLSEGALASLPTPCYLLDEAQLRRNGEILLGVQQRTGCKILLAQKAFSNFDLYPLLAPCLAGTEASGLYESRLGKEELPEKENHVFCAAYRVDEFNELLDYADHIVFNSPAQLAKFGPAAKAAGKSVGLRINPERSTQEGHAIYDPCAPGSRLGTTRAQWDTALEKQPGLSSLLDGLHFHTLCEQDADALAVTLDADLRSRDTLIVTAISPEVSMKQLRVMVEERYSLKSTALLERVLEGWFHAGQKPDTSRLDPWDLTHVWHAGWMV